MQKTLSFLLVATFALSSLIPSFVLAKTVTTATKTTAKTTTVTKSVVPVKKAVVVKKPVAKKKVAVKKPVVKMVTIAKKSVASTKPKGAIVAVSNSAVSIPVTTCMQAIKKANTFCSKIAKGCASSSVTAKCVKANQQCEDQQNAALALCPTI